MKVLVTGDFCPAGRIAQRINDISKEELFTDFLPYIENSDVAITCLECPLTDSTIKISKTGPSLKASPLSIRLLKEAGFNLVTLANNHIMDYSVKGLEDTLSVCDAAGIGYVGAGKNKAELTNTYYKTIHGITVAIINVCENEWSTVDPEVGAHSLDPARNYALIQAAKKNADYVFIITHGGHEMYHFPSPRMKQTFRFFIEAGADSIINSHTHCISGYEVYHNKPIFYSMGNFLFDGIGQSFLNNKNINDSWNEGYAVLFQLGNNGLSYQIIPYIQNNHQLGIKLMNEEERQKVLRTISSINKIIENDTLLEEEFNRFCFRVSKQYQSFIEPYRNKYLHALRNRRLIPTLLSHQKKLLLKNIIRCESHREVITHLLPLQK